MFLFFTRNAILNYKIYFFCSKGNKKNKYKKTFDSLRVFLSIMEYFHVS